MEIIRASLVQREARMQVNVVPVVSGGENRGHKSCTLHRRISIKNWVPLYQGYQKQLEQSRTTWSQLFVTN